LNHPIRSIVFLVCLAGMASAGHARDVIYHTLGFADRLHHYVSVESRFPAQPGKPLILYMPVWTPGSYLVREYARHVGAVTAQDSHQRPLQIHKISKNRWRVEAGERQQVTVRYRVYAHEMSVRTSWVDTDFALLNAATIYLVPVGGEALAQRIQLQLPAGWTKVATAMQAHGQNEYRARDFDQLIDSPMVMGDLTRYEFTVDGKPHALVNVLQPADWDGKASAEDVATIVQVQSRFWGGLPYARYQFLNLIVGARGGLEHKASTTLMTRPLMMRKREDYIAWLGTVSHEFFHTWNVKRLRPEALGPFDYEHENYTSSLWIAEGFTSYYGPLLLRRAGLITSKEYFKNLARDLRRLDETPGQAVRSAAQSSLDAWIKLYRPDENTINSAVSYYTKGAIIAFVLDSRIRAAAHGHKSLDDVMREAYRRYSGTRGYTPEQFNAVVVDLADESTANWLQRVSRRRQALDYRSALDFYGLTLNKRETVKKGEPEPEAVGWLGETLVPDSERLLIRQLRKGTPAYVAGLDAGDEILGLNDYRVTRAGWNKRLEHYSPGAKVTLLVDRRGRLLEIPARLGRRPAKIWKLKVAEDAGMEQTQHLKNWQKCAFLRCGT